MLKFKSSNELGKAFNEFVKIVVLANKKWIGIVGLVINFSSKDYLLN